MNAVIEVSVEAIILSIPIRNTMKKKRIDQRGDTLKFETAYGKTIKAKPASELCKRKLIYLNLRKENQVT